MVQILTTDTGAKCDQQLYTFRSVLQGNVSILKGFQLLCLVREINNVEAITLRQCTSKEKKRRLNGKRVQFGLEKRQVLEDDGYQ